MDHQPHVRLVDAHAEGIGCRDGPQLARYEPLLNTLLGFRRQTRMEVVGRHLLRLEELRHLFGPTPGGAVDDGASGRVRRQVRHQDLVDVVVLFGSGGLNYHEFEILAPCSTIEHSELCPEFLPEVSSDVGHDIGLRGRGEANHRWDLIVACPFPDEASHVAVVGTKVVPPSRQAVGLVQHPSSNLTLAQDAPKGRVAELLGGDEHHARVPESDPLQSIRPLGNRKQTVDGHTRPDAVCFKSCYLVRHERDERGDHHREGTGLVVAGQGGDLVAERLSGACGEDPQDVFSRHRCFDDGLLHGATVRARRLGTEAVETEPAAKFLAGIVPLPAPLAGGVSAGGVSQLSNQPCRLGELVAYPRRHDGVAAGH